jgi:hypothetical protein
MEDLSFDVLGRDIERFKIGVSENGQDQNFLNWINIDNLKLVMAMVHL